MWIVWPPVSVCPADGITSCDSIWIDTIKSIHQEEYIVLPYNTRASTLWTPFDGGILGCQKGVAFHDHPATWLNLS